MGVTLAGLIASLPAPAFGPGSSVAALFPPWWSQERVLAAATQSGSLLDVGGWSSVVVLAFTDKALPDRLRESGALIVLDARAVGCFASPK
ncbi:hypothetical protein [Jiella avicenniae]|uniref:Uncharacterized protein n=1 Tax=Jiella avicenniae TaxID=2907202 RepID=A0A9X1P1I7_9HYPH|nr:hypothetical protein [Jiella avicenniae]MCE7029692.1 hypothetical protein [Jiella avicenniae]